MTSKKLCGEYRNEKRKKKQPGTIKRLYSNLENLSQNMAPRFHRFCKKEAELYSGPVLRRGAGTHPPGYFNQQGSADLWGPTWNRDLEQMST